VSRINHTINISALQNLKMKKPQRRKVTRKKENQLTLSFSENIPFEIHIPRFRIDIVNMQFTGEKKSSIGLVRS